jgi:DNA modification methylase
MHGRKFVGCEVDETYYQKSLQRIESTEKQSTPIDFF